MDKKKIKILVLVNTLQTVPSFIYANHIDFFVYTAKHMPEIEFIFFTPHRMSIDNARNQAAVYAMRYQCDYLFFLDDDVMVPTNTLELLLASEKDVVAGLVIIRGMPFNVMAFKFADALEQRLDYYNKLPLVEPCKEGHSEYEVKCSACRSEESHLQELVLCDAVGFSCCLIKTDIFQALQPPFFVTGPNHTEDVYFCMKMRHNLLPIPEIYMNTLVRCGHLLNPEPIEFATRKKMFDFYKDEWDRMNASPGRDESHLKRCLYALGSDIQI